MVGPAHHAREPGGRPSRLLTRSTTWSNDRRTHLDDPHVVLATMLHRVALDIDLDDIDPDVLLQDAADLDSMDVLNMMTAL
jgi:hypothetical protein